MTNDRTLMNYKLEKVLGEGGMGTVYLGTHIQIGHRVAIKELLPKYAQDFSIRQRFKNEASLMANLKHPNIVSLHDYIETPTRVLLVMEYVEGITLDKYISKKGALPEEQAIKAFAKILEAFQYAHLQGIIHRDIKPANIMITKEGGIKILDFGIAKNTNEENKALTQTGIRLGTIYYMSPEQVRSQELDVRSDLYSLGLMLFEMLIGTNPYENQNLSEFDIASKIVHEPLPVMKDFEPNISPYLQRVLDKATAKKPQFRFQTSEEFRRALLHIEEVENVKEKNKNESIEWSFEKNEKKSSQWLKSENKTKTSSTGIKKTKENLIFQNQFGIITNHRLVYYKGKDYFDKGKKYGLYLSRTGKIEIKKHKEWFAAFLFIGVAIYTIIFFPSMIVYIIASILGILALLCLGDFPSIIIHRLDKKKIIMRAWPWHYKQAEEYAFTLSKVLREEQENLTEEE